MDYRFAGVRRTLAFGKYPQTTLADAREKRLAARKLLGQDIDPSQEKKERARVLAEANANTFEKLAREWHANHFGPTATEPYTYSGGPAPPLEDPSLDAMRTAK
jgi:hypothetical protein